MSIASAVRKRKPRRAHVGAPAGNGNGVGGWIDGPPIATGEFAGDPRELAKAMLSEEAARCRGVAELRSIEVDVKQLRASPFQPRGAFPDEEIRELADSIVAHGQLSPVLCRHFPGSSAKGADYELIDGERRWRAAKLAGLKTLRAEVGEFTDAQARSIVLVSALARKELNAIEEARAFRAALDAGDAPGPTELARQLGLSQGHVSNRLRLLELPESLQRRVISQEMPPTHARAVLPFCRTPGLVKAVERQIDADLKHGGLGTVGNFQYEMTSLILRDTRPMEGTDYDYGHGGQTPVFAPTEEQARALGVVEVEIDGRAQQRATNLRLWEKLQKKHAKAYHAEREKAGRAKPAKDANGKPRKRTAAEEARLAKVYAEQYQRWLQQYLTDVRRWILSRYLKGDELVGSADQVQLLRVALYFAGTHQGHAEFDFYRALHRTPDEDLVQKAGQVMAEWFFDKDGPRQGTHPQDVWALFADLGLDLETVWLQEQFGPLSEAYWQRQNKERLAELAAELKVQGVTASSPKGQMVKALLARIPGPEDKEVGIDLPREIKKCKLGR